MSATPQTPNPFGALWAIGLLGLGFGVIFTAGTGYSNQISVHISATTVIRLRHIRLSHRGAQGHLGLPRSRVLSDIQPLAGHPGFPPARETPAWPTGSSAPPLPQADPLTAQGRHCHWHGQTSACLFGLSGGVHFQGSLHPRFRRPDIIERDGLHPSCAFSSGVHFRRGTSVWSPQCH